MRKYIAEYEKYIEITGFRIIKIDDAKALIKTAQKDNNHKAVIQFFNADLVATWEHLYFAALNALLAFDTQRNISRNAAMEMMLYASAQRQIRKAIEFIGVKNGIANVAVALIDSDGCLLDTAVSVIKKRFSKEPDDSILEISESKMKRILNAFGISETEIQATIEKRSLEHVLVNLVIERMALLSTQL